MAFDSITKNILHANALNETKIPQWDGSIIADYSMSSFLPPWNTSYLIVIMNIN